MLSKRNDIDITGKNDKFTGTVNFSFYMKLTCKSAGKYYNHHFTAKMAFYRISEDTVKKTVNL